MIDGSFVLNTTPKQSDYVSLPTEYAKRRKNYCSEGPAAKKNKVVLYAVKKKLQTIHNMSDKDERRHAEREYQKQGASLEIKPYRFVDFKQKSTFGAWRKGPPVSASTVASPNSSTGEF